MSQSVSLETVDRHEAPNKAIPQAPRYIVPSPTLVELELPLIVQNIDRCVQTLGGNDRVRRLVDPATREVAAHLSIRPSDHFSRSVESCVLKGENLLLQVQVPKWTGRKRKRGSHGPFMTDTSSRVRDDFRFLSALRSNPDSSSVSVVAKTAVTHRFRDAPDFVWSNTTSPFLSHFRETVLSNSLSKIMQFKFESKQNRTELIPPPVITPSTTPWNWSYRQNASVKTIEVDGNKVTFNTSKRPQDRLTSVIYDVAEIPAPTAQELDDMVAKLGESDQTIVAGLRRAFDVRPIWTRRGLRNAMGAENVHPNRYNSLLLSHVAYTFSSGPWRDSMIRYGVDPRTEPEMRAYQTMFFKVDDNMAKHQNCPEPPTGLGHLFDGASIDTSSKIWQACDVTDPLVKTILDKAEIRSTCDKQSGWYTDDTWAKVKAITKAKIRRLVATGRPLDNSTSLEVHRILDSRDRSQVGQVSLNASQDAYQAAGQGIDQVRRQIEAELSKAAIGDLDTGFSSGEHDQSDMDVDEEQGIDSE